MFATTLVNEGEFYSMSNESRVAYRLTPLVLPLSEPESGRGAVAEITRDAAFTLTLTSNKIMFSLVFS